MEEKVETVVSLRNTKNVGMGLNFADAFIPFWLPEHVAIAT